jgi:hypothetical protein
MASDGDRVKVYGEGWSWRSTREGSTEAPGVRDGDVDPDPHPPFFFSSAHTASGVKGLLSMRTPTASKMALPMAGRGPLMPISLTDFAP